ncbi:hypothetical protein ABSA28_01152 [Candidatus Hepatincolaceae symbiont of Richtersius coronifer]
MPINEQSAISKIEAELREAGFSLGNAPKTKEFISIIVTNILSEVKKATVNVPGTGLMAPSGGDPVSGNGKGTIS